MNYAIKFYRDGEVVLEYSVDGATASVAELKRHYTQFAKIFSNVTFDNVEVVSI